MGALSTLSKGKETVFTHNSRKPDPLTDLPGENRWHRVVLLLRRKSVFHYLTLIRKGDNCGWGRRGSRGLIRHAKQGRTENSRGLLCLLPATLKALMSSLLETSHSFQNQRIHKGEAPLPHNGHSAQGGSDLGLVLASCSNVGQPRSLKQSAQLTLASLTICLCSSTARYAS